MSKAKAGWWSVFIPTHRDEAAMDGAPATATARTTAKTTAKAGQASVYIPTHRKSAMDGAPESLWR